MSRCVCAPIILNLEKQEEHQNCLQTILFDLWSNPLLVTSQENGWDCFKVENFKVHQRRVQWSISYVCQKNEYRYLYNWIRAFPGGSDGKESACNAGDVGSILGLGRFPGEGHGYPLKYSCLENSMDGGAWQATVCGVTESQTQLND